jgi:chromosomal replication initiator protein
MTARFGVSNVRQGLSTVSIGLPQRPRSDTPREYAGIALRRPSGRCYPHRALGAGTFAGQAPDTRISGDLERRPAEPETLRVPLVVRFFATPLGPLWRPIHPSNTLDRDIIDRMDAKQVWRAALGELQVSLSPANFETWLRDTQLVDVDEQRFRIGVPNGFAKDWLENRYRSLISQTLARIVGYSVQVEFSVVPADPAAPGEDGVAPASSPPAPQVRLEPGRVGGEGSSANLNPRYTFANFIVGSANRLAHAASLSVAERPGHAYNPLFLYGGVGLGKTHLMHAIGSQVIAKFPRKRVVYATSEKFTNEFITSIQQGKIDEFRARYRRIDLLLIDDIQFIADKERTQEEFFHTFNAIHEDGKQIVLSSDRPPKAILTLEERLRSRFEWGLIADLTAPDLETRIAILRAKAEEGSVPITSDVIEFIARKVVSNIRELEGALNRIVAFASMGATPISIELAQAVLSNVLYNPKKRQVTPERIAKAVADYYGVPMDALQGQKRDKAIVTPRQVAMFLMREETDVSLLRIGAELGGRDHSTVLHACDKITRESAVNDELRREIAAVRELIYAD